jgi:L-idonate 5-dehydrogenase
MDTRICRLHAQHDIRIETQAVHAPGPGEVLVAMATAGICGSDLHYFQHGGFGTIRVREPIILGHEAAGTIAATGPGVRHVAVGDRVAVNPSRPCGRCEYCAHGLPIHCLEMRFSGSAMRFPHEQGLFRDRIVVDAAQCVPVGNETDFAEAACAEPLAVCLHARAMAGDLSGKRVLVTGAGPIGALCTAVAAEAGAAEVVVTDLQDFTLEIAASMGATRTVNVANHPAEMARYGEGKGYFDVVFECSGAAPALASAIACIRPRGTLVQVGIGGETPVPLNLIVSKELRVQGTQRFHDEFWQAVEAIRCRRIDLRPIVTGRFPLADATAAFEAAGDRSRSVKVHLAFEGA